jgi:hypothetical protein
VRLDSSVGFRNPSNGTERRYSKMRLTSAATTISIVNSALYVNYNKDK